MANDEDLARIRQGAAVWNAWRTQNREPMDLSDATLFEANLEGADLYQAYLAKANLSRAHLAKANLIDAQLGEANFSGANLRGANLRGAFLYKTDLRGANLRGALLAATFLSGADLSGAELYDTVFANVDLSATKGLDACTHEGPSILDHRTLQRSGRLPLIFLRGCGLPDRLIDYLPSLLEEAIQYYSCFISYSSKDDAFAKRLHADLQNTGVRCWFAPHDLQIGAKTWDAIDAAIKVRDKVLLILSKSAIDSDWVENEVSKAFAEERRRKQTVLFPSPDRSDGDDDLRAVGGDAARSAEHRRLQAMEGPRCLPAGVQPGPARPEGGARVILPRWVDWLSLP